MLKSIITKSVLFFCLTFTAVLAETEAQKRPDEFEVTTYGSFVHFKGIPTALFFFEEIAKNDSFEFRKALRNHDIDTVVLWSNGGSVFEGLQMAGIIYDKKLTTFVPKHGECYSACSFMFFGGNTKVSNGLLGVHQFSSDEQASKKSEQVGKTQEISQFTVSEIVGFLNEFETPPWVFEKMFQQQEMYVFSREELSKLEKRSPDYDIATISKIEGFLTRLDAYLSEEACDEDLAECSAEQLCERSTKDDRWLSEVAAQKYVKEAKRQGLSCNVTEVNSTCISDPTKCSDEQLCSEVTMNKNGVAQWRRDASVGNYLAETKQRGLQCGVSDVAPSTAKLSIYTTKNDFKVGDSVKLEISSTESCRLTLLNIDDDNDSCVLYPSEAFGDEALIAGRAFTFPPAGSLRFAEAGTETIIAICNYSQKAIDAQLRDTNSVSCYRSNEAKPNDVKAQETILETLILDYTDGDIATLNDIPDGTTDDATEGDTVKAVVQFNVSE